MRALAAVSPTPSLLLQCSVMDAHGLYAYLLHAVGSYYVSAWKHSGTRNEIGERLEGREKKHNADKAVIYIYSAPLEE